MFYLSCYYFIFGSSHSLMEWSHCINSEELKKYLDSISTVVFCSTPQPNKLLASHSLPDPNSAGTSCSLPRSKAVAT
jgi:hypothetical protein